MYLLLGFVLDIVCFGLLLATNCGECCGSFGNGEFEGFDKQLLVFQVKQLGNSAPLLGADRLPSAHTCFNQSWDSDIGLCWALLGPSHVGGFGQLWNLCTLNFD